MERHGPTTIDERFDRLDPDVWMPAYMPAWSSRADAAATWRVDAEGLHLSIPPDQQRWCPDSHEVPLRVSAVQSGNWSGPVGGARGQQPFREGLVVREQQPPMWGFTPHFGRIEVECRATIGTGSMFSAWMVGVEDRPERSGEICLIEVFGSALGERDGRATARLGHGIHPFRDPLLREEFAAPEREFDVTAWHSYAVDWRSDGVEFRVDGRMLSRVAQAPDYPMQLILGVFDFPAEHPPPDLEPELVVRAVTGRPPAA